MSSAKATNRSPRLAKRYALELRTASEVWRAGVFPLKAIDLTGSGDAFTAGLITGILRGWEIRQMLSYASALGASSTRAIGTTDGVFTAEEAQAFLTASPLDIAYERLD